ncbi:DUF1566 domain-containing protein [Leptospira sp. 'Mane']|uniref:Lcl domain-containing protein n=1 Tax=Leptospira sp. 'Mane' TaxID=3387407 RepID=UPI00398A5D49
MSFFLKKTKYIFLFVFITCSPLDLSNPRDTRSSLFLMNRLIDCVLSGCGSPSGSLSINLSPKTGTVMGYSEPLTITAGDANAKIRYTTDNTEPNSNSSLYTKPLQPSKDFVGKTIKAVAMLDNGTTGAVAEGRYYFPVLKTEQNVCYDNATLVVACDPVAHKGQDGLVQTGKAQSYIGPTAHSTYTSNITTFDNNTGLTWQTCVNGRSDINCSTGTDTGGTLSNALTNCANLNSSNSNAGYAGLTNWRLPSMQEVFSLLRQGPNSISAANFPATQPSYLLSSTLDPTDTANRVYNIGFINQVASSTLQASSTPFRCVSGSPLPSYSFTDQGDGTLFDNTTGIYWTKCLRNESAPNCSGTAISTDWAASVSYCSGLTYGGRSWRLPNVNEIVGLIDPSATSAPYIRNVSLFSPNLTGKILFSSSTWVNVSYPNRAVGLTLSTGIINNDNDKSISNYALCVSGP